uniref:Acyl-CoA thioesterase-like C-terminal domain-containing protein n=1 Tax=Caenorhabditis japonica TaxID=281687 RepID=A0A8R1E923_CAEJA
MVSSRTKVISSMLSIDNIEKNIYRSEGPHVGNIPGPKRVFGGYVVAQAYKAVKEYTKKIQDENPIFREMDKSVNSKVNKLGNIYAVDVFQDKKSIGLAHVKTNPKLLEPPLYPTDLPALLSLPDLSTLISLIPTESEKNRMIHLRDHLIYELRPVHMKQNAPGEHRAAFYARLSPESVAHLVENSGMAAVVALSDFFVMLSAMNILEGTGHKVTTASSMHHKINFHQENVEVAQWFLVESRTEVINLNKSKIHGAIFDSNKNCVISFIQEAYMVPKKLESKI